MPELIFPLETAPGDNLLESGGRLINAYAEKSKGRSKHIWRRAPGLLERFVTGTDHRGSLLVGSVLYVISGTKAYTVTKSGAVYTVTELSGDAIGGTGKVFMDRNMNGSGAEILIVHSAGMSYIDTSSPAVADFSDGDLPATNSICFVGSYFFATIGDGRCFASGQNAVSFSANDFTNAESTPDGLTRAVRYGRDLALFGQKSLEFWSNTGNPRGFPFSFSSSIPVGLLTPHAVAGFELGFGQTIVFVAADRTVQALMGYAATKISNADLDNLLAAVEDVDELEMSVYVSKGRAVVVLSCDDWTWEYTFPSKTTEGGWTERKSYGEDNWRAMLGVNAFDEWLVFDRDSNKVFKVDSDTKLEGADPLVVEIRTVPDHAFPSRIEYNRVALDMLVGVGIAAGQDPIETDPRILLSYSDDGGRTFSNERELRLGGQGEMVTVEAELLGTTGSRGRQWKIRMSDPVIFGLMGGAWDGKGVK